MPLGRYFAFTGSVLLALLFLADWCMPDQVASPAVADIDRTIIRIHTAHKWPEAIVIDTSLPTIVPPPAAPSTQAPQEKKSARDALALAPPEIPPAQTASTVTARSIHQRRTKSTRAVNRVVRYDAIGFRNTFPADW